MAKYDRGMYANKYSSALLLNVILTDNINKMALKIGIKFIAIGFALMLNGERIKYIGSMAINNMIDMPRPVIEVAQLIVI
ncbi:MAG: hypothetical protein NC390_02645 [Fusobacterium sp.]|nr:hypothetical protein [Fusobacterium sp.]